MEQKEGKQAQEELSDEDLQLQETLSMLVHRVQDPDLGIQRAAIESMKGIIRTSTSSMTSVPKPLKFLKDQVPSLVIYWDTIPAGQANKPLLADVLSVLHMCIPSQQSQRSVLYFQLNGTKESIEQWGHEYVKHLAMEIVSLYGNVSDGQLQDVDNLLNQSIQLATEQIVPFFLAHNSEPDACDLLVELERLDLIPGLVTRQNYNRICLYLSSCASYEPFPYNNQLLQTVYQIYLKMGKLPEAVYVAIRLNDPQLVLEVLWTAPAEAAYPQELVQRQLCYIVARYPVTASAVLSQLPEHQHQLAADQFERLMRILRNEHYAATMKEVGGAFGLLDDSVAPKAPEDIYKSYLDSRPTDPSDSAKVACANAIVNGLINMSLCRDRFLVNNEADRTQADSWIYRPKNEGIACAVASIGCICRGNFELGLSHLDRYFESPDPAVRAGAILSVGLLSGGACVRDECDAGLALVQEHVVSNDPVLRESALISLLFGYPGTCNQRIQELLIPLISDTVMPVWSVALSCLALANTFVGSCDGEIISLLLQILMEREQDFATNRQPFRMMALSLGLLHWGKQGAADPAIEAVRVLTDQEMSITCSTIVTGCAYAGSGNVVQIQQLLHLCSLHDKEKASSESKDNTDSMQTDTATETTPADDSAESKDESPCDYRSFAVLGVALVSTGEDVGSEMALRLMNHLMYYGDASTKRAVPLALALSSPSNPQVPVIDVLSKYSHDADKQVALGATVALGIVGAGTGNSRIGNLLRALANFYYKDQLFLSAVKLAQGFLNASRGLYTLSPLSHGRTLLDPASMASLLTYLVCLSDPEEMLFARFPSLHYLLACAMTPRSVVTVDEDGNPVKVLVRVGMAIDTVGLAGTPKTITAHQTHTTPVLLATGERAEIVHGTTGGADKEAADQNWQPVTGVLEGTVMVTRNTMRIGGAE